MTATSPAPSLSWTLLREGIPPTLLIDLLDPAGLRIALAEELLPHDVARAPAPQAQLRETRTA